VREGGQETGDRRLNKVIREGDRRHKMEEEDGTKGERGRTGDGR